DEGELVQDLNMLFLSGLPPYGPGDLIDVEVDEGRVWIGMADYFSRPVRLTHQEALSLYLRGKSLLGAPGLAEAPALASALARIEQRLGPEALGALAGAGRPLYTRSEGDVGVRLLLGPGARWVAEYYVTESPSERGGGAIEVILPTKDLAWVVKLVLRLGGEATVLAPPELAARV